MRCKVGGSDRNSSALAGFHRESTGARTPFSGYRLLTPDDIHWVLQRARDVRNHARLTCRAAAEQRRQAAIERARARAYTGFR